MKNKKAENAITAVLAAAVLLTGGMSLHSYLSEQRAKMNTMPSARRWWQSLRRGNTGRDCGEKLSGATDRLCRTYQEQPGFSWMALFPGIGHQLSGGTGGGQ